ncbi:wax ester/triacylglycerol synthase domain-containing protein [Nonomuraea sp. NPDC005650]|uniref:wax ester/triacylglycerol synthase domain-containing protein n=1 Tax=Nonomuraea sp. NPDC005650 TaxID=3157045 RepID=UPI0033A122E8
MALGAHLPGPPPAPEDLHRLIADKVRQAPVLRYRLTGSGRRACWAPDPRFDPARHVEHHRLRSGQDLHQAVADVLGGRPLSRERPLWRLAVLHGHAAGEHVLLYYVHHAFQDALGLLSVVRALSGDETLPLPAPAPRAEISMASTIRRALPDLLRMAGAPPRWHPTRTASGTNRRLLVVPLDMQALHDIARRTDATITQIGLALVAGALRAWRPELRRSSVRRRGAIAINLAVSLRGRRDHAALGNRVCFLPITLPCAEPSPRERLRLIAEQSTLAKIVHQRRTAHGLYEIPAAVARPMFRIVLPLATRGQPNRLDVGVIQASRVFPGALGLFVCPPLAPGVAGMLTVLHSGDTASISGVFDTHVARPEQLLDLVRAAVEELRADVVADPEGP